MRDPITGQDRDGHGVVAVVKGPDFVHMSFQAAVVVQIRGGVVRNLSRPDSGENRCESSKEDENPPRWFDVNVKCLGPSGHHCNRIFDV